MEDHSHTAHWRVSDVNNVAQGMATHVGATLKSRMKYLISYYRQQLLD